MSLVVERMPEIGITRVSRWCFNCYLVEADDGGVVVVDAGMPTAATDLAPLVAAAGPVRAITATHGHCDHLGGAVALATQHEAPIFLPKVTLSYLQGVHPRTPSAAKLARTWRLLFGQPFDLSAALGFARAAWTVGFGTSRGMLWPGPVPPGELTLRDPLPAASAWTVHPAAGHTDDSIVLWNADRRTLLSGDAVITIGGRPRFAPDTIDTTAAEDTRTRLLRYRPSTCYPDTACRFTPNRYGHEHGCNAAGSGRITRPAPLVSRPGLARATP